MIAPRPHAVSVAGIRNGLCRSPSAAPDRFSQVGDLANSPAWSRCRQVDPLHRVGRARPGGRRTAISLAVVFANASSGSFSYYRLRRADYRSGLWLAAATLPGAVLGAIVVSAIPRGAFEVLMGIALLAVGSYLLVRPSTRMPLLTGARFVAERTITDSSGRSYSYRFNLGLAVLLSVGVGFLSSILGIGGGIIHVPLLTTFFSFPEQIAAATSHFVLMFTAGAATGTHAVEGDYANSVGITIALAVGVLAGAPIGAAISSRIEGLWIVRLLAVALGIVGVRLLLVAALR